MNLLSNFHYKKIYKWLFLAKFQTSRNHLETMSFDLHFLVTRPWDLIGLLQRSVTSLLMIQ
jgi:hypothetical protein